MPRVLVVRGHFVNPWELAPWAELPADYEVAYLLTGSNQFATPGPRLAPVRVRALRDLLPSGVVGEAGATLLGDRYIGADEAFAWADIVHAEELSFWFAAEAARRQRRHGYRLVQTVWETLPLLDAWRNPAARRRRAEVLNATDLFLPTTRRAADALTLEGVAAERIRVCPPGVDLERFAAAAPSPPPTEYTVVSPGRLVWEKGHHDVLRAAAALRRGLVGSDEAPPVNFRFVGAGPEEGRLRTHARELGLESAVTFAAVPHDEMPAVFARASAMVLASLPSAGAPLHPLGLPRAFWEEQFGMVLAEAMAAGTDIVASASGAIPEVLAGTPAQIVAPGDWMGIAAALADGPLRRPPGARVSYPRDVVDRYSTRAAAARLADAYASLRQ